MYLALDNSPHTALGVEATKLDKLSDLSID